jgi:hypothetical protein
MSWWSDHCDDCQCDACASAKAVRSQEIEGKRKDIENRIKAFNPHPEQEGPKLRQGNPVGNIALSKEQVEKLGGVEIGETVRQSDHVVSNKYAELEKLCSRILIWSLGNHCSDVENYCRTLSRFASEFRAITGKPMRFER